jgi:hypothetical protein
VVEFNANIGRKIIFKPRNWNQNLYEINDITRATVVNFNTSRKSVVKSTIFLHRDIHKHKCIPTDGKTLTNHILINRRRHESTLDVRSFSCVDCDADHYLLVTKVKERLAASKPGEQVVHMERYYLKIFNEMEAKRMVRVNMRVC